MVSSKTLLLIVVILATYVVSLSYYISSYDSLTATENNETVYVQITVGPNATVAYLPDSFNVLQGKHVTLVVSNGDVVDHGLAIPKYDVDTGIIPGGGSASVTFNANKLGTFEFDEPLADCGPAPTACDSLELIGNMTVTSGS